MKLQTIGFIGAGNMAASLVGGLIHDGYAAADIWITDVDESKADRFGDQFKVNVAASNQDLVEQVHAVVLSVKPQVMRAVAAEIASSKKDGLLHISIAAGIRSSDLERWLGINSAIVRAMPNTPALVRSGATGLYANAHTTQTQRDFAEKIMRAVGIALWVEDELMMDAVTALSGSGPAYFFKVMEAMESAGTKLGLSQQTARLLTIQTALGAAKLAMESSDSPSILREKVTSPGGTTEQALKTLSNQGIENIFEEAMSAAARRASELAEQFGVD